MDGYSLLPLLNNPRLVGTTGKPIIIYKVGDEVTIEKLNEKEILQYALENNIIDLSYVQEKIEMAKRKQMLDKHQYEIWQGNDGAWYTYFPDKEKSRKLKRRTSKKKLEDDIIAYYVSIEENPFITDLFERWNDERYENGEIGKNSYTKYGNDFKRFFQK